MNNSFKILVLAILIGTFGNTYAQQSTQLGHFDFLPQSVYANPAIKPKGKINVGIPALSGIYLEHNNNWFKPTEFVSTDANGSTTLDPELILSNIDQFATINQGFSLELFHFGMKFGKDAKHYAHFRIAERSQFGINIPKDVFNLAVYGNAGEYDFENNTADFSGLAINATHFREYALGYNMDVNKKMSFGATVKYLYGMEHINTRESSLRLYTDPETYALESSGTIKIETAGIYGLVEEDQDAVQSEINTYLTGLKNTGFGADLGFIYRPIEKLELQVSANDIGFVKWQSDVATFQSGNATFAYGGVDLSEFIFETGGDFDDALQNELDSLVDELENTYDFTTTHESFQTSLNGFMRYAASYELFDISQFTGSVWANFMHGVGQHNLLSTYSVGYNQKIGHGFQLGVHYTKRNLSTGAFGAGMVYNAGPVQFYCLADNFRFSRLTQVSLIDDQGNRTQLVYPTNPDDIRVNFGINLTFGMKDKGQGKTML